MQRRVAKFLAELQRVHDDAQREHLIRRLNARSDEWAQIGRELEAEISERSNAHEQTERLIALVESTPDLVGTFDLDRGAVYLNPGGRKLLGFEPADDISRRPLDDFFPASAVEQLQQRVRPAVARNGYWDGESALLGPEEREVAVRMFVIAHKNERDEVQSISMISRDLSKEKQAERLLREREQRLLRAQKLEAVGTLADGVAHEFNNVLQVIAGYTHYGMRGFEPDDPRLDDLNEVLNACDRASSLTRQLLGFSRCCEMSPSVISVNQLITDFQNILRTFIRENVEFEFIASDEPEMIRGDAGQLHQVLMNLCVNACDAMPSGGRLTIRTGRSEADLDDGAAHAAERSTSHVVIAVSDTGEGISADVQQRMFEPFFSTKPAGEGTGLGLAVVHRIVERHGGSIRVESDPETGTTYSLLLPAVEAAELAPEPAERSLPQGGSETILVAEDEEMVRNVIVRTLSIAGYTVLAAEDGDEAIERYNGHSGRVDLALLDVVMPRKGGREVYEEIKAHQTDLKVVFSTGYDAGEGRLADATGSGFDVLEKPFGPQVLLRTVRQVLDDVVPTEVEGLCR